MSQISAAITRALAATVLVAGLQQPVSAHTTIQSSLELAYKSCTYPKSSKPVQPYIPKATSWKQKGVQGLVKGVDISQWQHDGKKAIKFNRLKNTYKLSFVFIKASDGGNRDKGKSAYWFPIDSRAARAQNLIVGAYHYAVPGQLGTGTMVATGPKLPAADWDAKVKKARANRTKDAKLQAAMAYSRSGNNPLGDLPVTLDIEERPCGWTWQMVAAWSRDFLLEYERISGRKPIVYCNSYMINKLLTNKVVDPRAPGAKFDFSQYPLWVAQWSLKKSVAPPAQGIWNTNWTFWQFSSDGILKDKYLTIPVARTDLDVFNGSLQQLLNLANH